MNEYLKYVGHQLLNNVRLLGVLKQSFQLRSCCSYKQR